MRPKKIKCNGIQFFLSVDISLWPQRGSTHHFKFSKSNEKEEAMMSMPCKNRVDLFYMEFLRTVSYGHQLQEGNLGEGMGALD